MNEPTTPDPGPSQEKAVPPRMSELLSLKAALVIVVLLAAAVGVWWQAQRIQSPRPPRRELTRIDLPDLQALVGFPLTRVSAVKKMALVPGKDNTIYLRLELPIAEAQPVVQYLSLTMHSATGNVFADGQQLGLPWWDIPPDRQATFFAQDAHHRIAVLTKEKSPVTILVYRTNASQRIPPGAFSWF